MQACWWYPRVTTRGKCQYAVCVPGPPDGVAVGAPVWWIACTWCTGSTTQAREAGGVAPAGGQVTGVTTLSSRFATGRQARARATRTAATVASGQDTTGWAADQSSKPAYSAASTKNPWPR